MKRAIVSRGLFLTRSVNTSSIENEFKAKSTSLTAVLRKRYSALEQRFLTLSSEISKVSGYSTIEQLKGSVDQHGVPDFDPRDLST